MRFKSWISVPARSGSVFPARDAQAQSIFTRAHAAKQQAGIMPYSAPELCAEKALKDQGLFFLCMIPMWTSDNRGRRVICR
jgi:hypothetical protein